MSSSIKEFFESDAWKNVVYVEIYKWKWICHLETTIKSVQLKIDDAWKPNKKMENMIFTKKLNLIVKNPSSNTKKGIFEKKEKQTSYKSEL